MATNIQIRAMGVPIRGDRFGSSFAGAITLHAAVAAALLGWAYFSHRGQNWGDSAGNNGAIAATMVSTIPLPPHQATNDQNVLATEAPSPAPIVPEAHTTAAPKPEDIPIPVKPTKPVKTAEKTTPPPPLHPQPVKVDPTKVQTGEAPGVRIAMSSTQTRLGTFSVGVTDANFGARFAYYNEQIKQKLAGQWREGMLDPQAAGHRVYITFQVGRDGSPSHIKVETPSGDATLDQTALSAAQHVDTFGPLPDAYQGSYVNVQYYFEAPPHQ